MKERVENLPLVDARRQPWRHRRRVQRWLRQNQDQSAVVAYGKFPPYGRLSFVGPAWVVVTTVYRRQGRKLERVAQPTITSIDWHLAARIVEVPSDRYEIWMMAGSQHEKQVSVRLRPGEIHVVYVVAHHVGLVRRLFKRHRTTEVYHGTLSAVT